MRRLASTVPLAACAAVIAVYAAAALTAVPEAGPRDPAGAYYNLQVEGFQDGHLYLRKQVPTGLERLSDPYDPAANASFRNPHTLEERLHDLSYYRGRLYLYFGVAPALLLFWPYEALTGHYLGHPQAVLIFAAIGLLVGAWLVRDVVRRHFPEQAASPGPAGALLALGLASGLPLLMQRPYVWEVPVSCAFACSMAALALLWRALHEDERRGRWLFLASAAYGLALGSRPSMLFGAAALALPAVVLIPASPGPRKRRWVWLASAAAPLAAACLGLAAYNVLRFGRPLEFGQSYQLASDRQDIAHFGLGNLWFNVRTYLLAPARWEARFPFVAGIRTPSLPAGHPEPEYSFGLIPNAPFLLLALAAPLAWWNRPSLDRSRLRGLAAAAALLFGSSFVVLCLFYGSCGRYEIDFLPPLAILAVLGLLAVERRLASLRGKRWSFRCAWMLLLAFSVAFNLLVAVERRAEMHYAQGNALLILGRPREAVAELERALALKANLSEANNDLGTALAELGRVDEAIGRFRQALDERPGYVEARFNLANALALRERYPEAIGQYEQVLRRDPGHGGAREALAEAHNNLGVSLAETGRMDEAAREFEAALVLKPDYAEAGRNLELARRRR